MQDKGTATKPWYRACSTCGRQVFSDLLDGEGVCDYCREVRSMKASVMRSKRARKAKAAPRS